MFTWAYSFAAQSFPGQSSSDYLTTKNPD
jgi:hypothetical protein